MNSGNTGEQPPKSFSLSVSSVTPPPPLSTLALALATCKIAITRWLLVPVILRELEPSSPFFKHGQSLQVTGRLEAYQAETGIAKISDRNNRLKINTRHLTDLVFCAGSLYQFIGELVIGFNTNNVLLQARVGRMVEGLDLNLYQQSLHLSRKLESYISIASRSKRNLG